ncbi:MAG: transcription termination/antitermination protein NusA [Chlamydiae bacterium]|nr:transcription termination/antitermination protein NusA [Chlamydiota bacterium]
MNKELLAIFEYLEREKGIKRDFITKAIEDALVVAARKGNKHMNNVSVTVDPRSGTITAIAEKEIVEKVEYPDEEISLEEAKQLDPYSKVGDWIDVIVDPQQFGRIAAQTARQVISQKLRGAERDVIYEEYRHRVGELISGTVRRVTKGHTLVVDLGKVEALLPGRFYPKTERYHIGDKVLALLYEVQDTENGGAEVILTRSHPDFVIALFSGEVPEISDGIIHIKKAVREAGYRTKMAVYTSDMKIDAVGACVGVRGSRVKNIIRELGGEKIDILPYSEDPSVLLKNALSPLVPKKVDFCDETNTVTLIVEDEDYPAILGKKGINARLTGDLIGARIEVHKVTEYQKEMAALRETMAQEEDSSLDEEIDSISEINQLIVDNLISSGFNTPRKIFASTPQEIAKLADISLQMVESILEQLSKKYRK